MKKKQIYLILFFLLLSCNTKKELSKIAPMSLDGNKKVSEKLIVKELDSISEFNNNHKLKELLFSKYEKKIIIKRFKYNNSLTAYSEYSTSYDLSHKSKNSYFEYHSGNKNIILDKDKIWVIENSKNSFLKELGIKPQSDIKLPKEIKPSILGTEKLILNDDDTFPFYTKYVQRDHLFNDVRVSSIVSYQNEKNEKLIEFIKKQNIIEETEKTIYFSLKEDSENRFLWIKDKKVLLLNFLNNEVEKLLSF